MNSDAMLAQAHSNALADSIIETCKMYNCETKTPVSVGVGERLYSMLCALNNGKFLSSGSNNAPNDFHRGTLSNGAIIVYWDRSLKEDAINLSGSYNYLRNTAVTTLDFENVHPLELRSDKRVIHVEEIKEELEKRRWFNSLDLNDVVLLENGEVVDHVKYLEEWKFLGLNNTDFIQRGVYRDGTIDGVSIVIVTEDESQTKAEK